MQVTTAVFGDPESSESTNGDEVRCHRKEKSIADHRSAGFGVQKQQQTSRSMKVNELESEKVKVGMCQREVLSLPESTQLFFDARCPIHPTPTCRTPITRQMRCVL